MFNVLVVSDELISESMSTFCSLQDWDLVCWWATCLVWSPESCVAAAQSSCARVVCWKVSRQQLDRTDAWQQLFEQQDITVICTIHFHPWLHENHTSAPAPGDTDWNRHAGTCLSCLSETSAGRQYKAVSTSDWTAVSNQQSLIKRLINGKIVLTHVSKSKANTLNICYNVLLCNCREF